MGDVAANNEVVVEELGEVWGSLAEACNGPHRRRLGPVHRLSGMDGPAIRCPI